MGSWPLWPWLWPLTLTFCMNITSVNGNDSWKFQDDTMVGTSWKKVWRTDGRTDRQTDRKKCSISCLVAAKTVRLYVWHNRTFFIVFIGQLGTWWGYTGLNTLGTNEINVRNTLPIWSWSHLNLRLSGPQPRALTRDQGERHVLTEGTCLYKKLWRGACLYVKLWPINQGKLCNDIQVHIDIEIFRDNSWRNWTDLSFPTRFVISHPHPNTHIYKVLDDMIYPLPNFNGAAV